MKNELKCHGEISEKGATCTFYAGGGHGHGIRFAIIYAYKTKDYGDFEFVSDPSHDFHDDLVRKSTYAFGDAGRNVRIVSDNVSLVKEYARHELDAAKKVRTDGGGS